MHDESAGLTYSPFCSPGRPAVVVPIRSQREAFQFLDNILTDERGIGLLHGPAASGKSVLIDQYIRELQTDVAVAVVDGARLKTQDLLAGILTQYGYDVDLGSVDELLNLLTMFAVQQSRVRHVPLLIIENINDMYPSALCALCELASITTSNGFALRIILVSNRDFQRVVDSPRMTAIAQRMIGAYELTPMSAKETAAYLYAKLRAAGVARPDDVFSVDVCDKLYAASSGWPGKLDDIAQSLMNVADGQPIHVTDIDLVGVAPDDRAPQLIVTLSGDTVQDFRLSASRALIGRSNVNDIVLEDQFVSKQHALLLRERDAVVLVDLKSANGTYVNSRRIRRTVLRDCDIISLGDHRIKISYANSANISGIEDPDLADTATLKNIVDARRAKARWDERVSAVDKKSS